MTKNLFIAKWHITEMEQWDSDFINDEVDSYIDFSKDDQGDFHFGYVQGSMDCEIETVEDKPRIEFSWIGNDEMDETGGRGWARIENNGTLFGKIAFHMGERSWFKAKRIK